MKKPFLRIGHRGHGEGYGENTMLSFELAIRAGANAIEYDVRQTKDGKLAVIHDRTVNRTTNGKGKVSDYTYEELLQFTAGYRESIPLFEEVLLKFRDRVFQNIELKEKGIAQNVLDVLRNCTGDEEGILVSAFDWGLLAPITLANIPTALLADKKIIEAMGEYAFITKALHCEVSAINPYFTATTPSLLDLAHKYALKVYPWTVDEPSDIARMKAYGADGIISNYPERL